MRPEPTRRISSPDPPPRSLTLNEFPSEDRARHTGSRRGESAGIPAFLHHLPQETYSWGTVGTAPNLAHYLTVSFSCFPGLNFTTLVAGILIGLPV
jgi:hypothetical protein